MRSRSRSRSRRSGRTRGTRSTSRCQSEVDVDGKTCENKAKRAGVNQSCFNVGAAPLPGIRGSRRFQSCFVNEHGHHPVHSEGQKPAFVGCCCSST